MLPPVTAMSAAVKFVLTSDKRKERAILLSVEAFPSLTVVENILTDGANLSEIKSTLACQTFGAFPAKSLKPESPEPYP